MGSYQSLPFPLNSTRLVLTGELMVRDVCGQIGMEQRAESKAIVPAAAEVCDVNVLKDTVIIHFKY